MRFTSTGRLGIVDGVLLTKVILIKLINEMGGIFIEQDHADTLMKTHSRLPNCFVLVKDKKDLVNATGYLQEVEEPKKKMPKIVNQNKSRHSTSQSSDSNSQYPSSQFTARQKKETAQNSQISQKFAQGDLICLKLKKTFIMDVKKVITVRSQLIHHRPGK